MKKYEVNLVQKGAMFSADFIIVPDDYTVDDYINDCRENADEDFNEMLELSDKIVFIEVEG